MFAGYGITAPEHDYDDYEDVDVDGKIVLLLRHVPGQALERGPLREKRLACDVRPKGGERAQPRCASAF